MIPDFIEQKAERMAKAHNFTPEQRQTYLETITQQHESRKNGPAFPDSTRQHWGHSGPCDSRTWPGLSKREYIAAMFVAGGTDSYEAAFRMADRFLDVAAVVDP